jgi:hypothetical protein
MRYARVVLGSLLLLALGRAASADITVLNLSNETIWYADGYREGDLWHCRGWYALASGKSVKLNASHYFRFVGDQSRKIYFNSEGSAADFWSHPRSRFWTSESNSDFDEVYKDGVRTSTDRLEDDGFEYVRFRRYKDNTTWWWGSYYKVGTKTYGFSHNSNGVKPPQSFSYLNNAIISYSVNLTSTRGVRTWPTWSLASNGRSVSMSGLNLKGGPAWDAWRPSYIGSVTLSYIYR